MLEPRTVLIVLTAGALVAGGLFLAALAVAGLRRTRGVPVGPRFTNLVTALGGITIGMMLVSSGNLVVAAPLLGVVLVGGFILLQQGRPREAGWLLAGAAAPWTALWFTYLLALYLRLNDFNFWQTWLGFLAGALPMLLGLMVAIARRLPDPAKDVHPRSTGRQLGDVARAILAPAAVGPFGLPEVGLVVALVATWIATGFLLPVAIAEPIRLGVVVVLGAVVGTEAWIRSMPAPARRAFEAFSWLGEWEIAQVRALTGGGIPTTSRAARQWLLAHPDRPEERWLRVEILLLARQLEEARAVADRMPVSTPQERVDRALAIDVVDWFAGLDGDIAAIEAAAQELDPADEEARLRVDVGIAVARVRRRLAAGDDGIEAGEPLRAVRERLGRRADGQLARAMRGRLLRVLLVVGAVVAGLFLLLQSLLPAV